MKKGKKSQKVDEILDDLSNDLKESSKQDSNTNQSEQDKGETESKSEERNYEAELAEANDKFLRLYSEFDNFRRRTAKERLELINSAGRDLMFDLLPVIDDFERAIKAVDETKDLKEGIKGFGLIYSKMQNILEQKGMKSFKAMEKDFDPDFHEAITKIPAPSKKLSGKVVDVIESGYMLNDKVLRYAKVVVGE